MALLNLNALNESFAKLDESMLLYEKMSDTMPKWLADRILTDKYTNTSTGLHKSNRWDKNPHAGPIPDYVNARDKSWSEKCSGAQGLYRRFAALGIDIASVPVHEIEVPTSANSPLFKDDNKIGIFLFDNGQVYAKGVNEDEVCRFDDRSRAFKITPKKTMLEHCIAAAYIDLNEIDTTAISTKQAERKGRKKIGDLDIPVERGMAGAREWTGSGYLNRDKSGYLPNPVKYTKKLADIRATRYQQTLNGFYDTLRSIKNSIASSFTGSDVGEEDTGNLIIDYARCARGYKELCSDIENILNSDRFTEDRKRELISNSLANTNLPAQLKNLEEDGKKIFDITLDW